MRTNEFARGSGGFVLCLLLAHPALALHPLITEDAFTVGAGTSQLEIGFEQIRIDGGTLS